MKVTLVAHTPDPEKVVACAAKVCYSSVGIDSVYDKLDDQKAAEFVEMLSQMGHESPIEHVSFTFAVEGISRSTHIQLVRHRIASYSVRSQRYVSENSFDYITPPEIADIPEALELYKNQMSQIAACYEKLSQILFDKHCNALIADGADPKKAKTAAQKKAIEDARYVLPNSCNTQLMLTMNARSLLNFFRLRCCMRAQWEIRELADLMLAECIKVAPALFANAGPACTRGGCPEGKMSCGKAAEIREKYQRLRETAKNSAQK